MASDVTHGFQCPACGWPHLTEPPWTEGGGGSHEICPSCGLHFGYDDHNAGDVECRPSFYRGWSVKWFTDGMRWSSVNPPPEGWDPEAQLESLRPTNWP